MLSGQVKDRPFEVKFMASSFYVLIIIIITILSCWSSSVHADKPRPRLLDGELIEEGQPSSEPEAAKSPQPTQTSQTVILLKEFCVTLPSNPSTGYGWKIASYDKDFLQLKSHRYQKPDKVLPGAPGREMFEFLPLKTGSTTIILHYQRPFEKQIAQELHHRIIIR
ncbi:MAG TPA: hypothetical protein DCY27_06575 [Desulfobacterales bacterium]|nr:hypothetical protein [Desulfobacterales bacterium]